MKKRYDKPLTARELAKLPDSKIDYSDMPPLDDAFWQNANLVLPENKERITLRLDRDILEFFRHEGKGYQTSINAVLRSFVESRKNHKPT